MFRRKRKASDFGTEIEAHLQLETVRLREKGLSEEEAWETGKHVVRNSYVWMAAIEHSAEHYGQLVVYYRANNLVPPRSRR
jgi:hypothetical protein